MTDHLGFGSAAHERIARQSKHLVRMIDQCSRRELEMLIRYYGHGEDEQQVIGEMGCTAEEFEQLRARMRSSARPPEPLKKRAATGQ